MPTPTQEIVDEQMLCNQDLATGIVFHRNDYLEAALEDGAQVNTRAPETDGTLAKSTPLGDAIAFDNVYAVKRLIEYGADVELTGEDGIPPLFIAVHTGNDKIVNLIINELKRKKSDINIFLHMTALSRTIISMPTFSLIHNKRSTWKPSTKTGDNVKERLAEWYKGSEEDFSDTPLRVTYFGDISTIAMLLNNGLDARTANVNGITPLMLAQNPKEYKHVFTSAERSPIKFLGMTPEGAASFKIQMSNRDSTKELEVIVDYDFRHILPLLETNLKMREETAASPEALARVEANLAEAYRRIEQRRLSNERVKAEHTPMFEVHSKKAQREKDILKCHEDLSVGAFCDEFILKLNSRLSSTMLLHSGMLSRADYSLLDKTGNIVSASSEFLPGPGSTIASLAAKLIKATSDEVEKNKHEQILGLIQIEDYMPLSKDLALQIIKGHKESLSRLTPDMATKLAEHTVEMVLERMVNTEFSKNHDLITQLTAELNKENAFQKAFAKHYQEQVNPTPVQVIKDKCSNPIGQLVKKFTKKKTKATA